MNLISRFVTVCPLLSYKFSHHLSHNHSYLVWTWQTLSLYVYLYHPLLIWSLSYSLLWLVVCGLYSLVDQILFLIVFKVSINIFRCYVYYKAVHFSVRSHVLVLRNCNNTHTSLVWWFPKSTDQDRIQDFNYQ